MKIKLSAKLNNFELSIDTCVNDTGICVIFGRSGSGKTTLINLIAGLIPSSNGHLSYADQCFYDSDKKINIPVHKRDIGYVFQQARLFPHLNVAANLQYGYLKKHDSDGRFFQQIIQLLQIEPLLHRYPSSLSGGEQQRVSIGRALLRKPKLLLMDEPLASLDQPRKRELLPYLEKLNKILKLPIIYVTHSLDEVLYLGDEMLLLEQGKLILQGDVEFVWNHPKMRPWLSTDNQCALLHASVFEQHPKYALSGLDLGDEQILWVKKINQPLAAKVRLRIYARDISLTLTKASQSETSIRNIFLVTIMQINLQDDSASIKLALGSNMLWADITLWALEALQLRVEQQLYAQIKGVSINPYDWANH